MVNTSYPELQETKVAELPPASLDTLIKLREDACSSSAFGFKLQPQQRFLRRVLSPDAPTQNLLLVHGTGVGKTCSAIQVAEEYIMRPEFQDKKVLVLANPSIQENFKNQIFDVSRVNIDAEGLLTSKQCTGRRYLDILQRGQKQPLKLSTGEQRETLRARASRIINEFYEFQGYGEFANNLEKQKLSNTPNERKSWIRATFDNRLVIVDEAHNLRETTETNVDAKFISAALKDLIQTANGITIVLLTATPMYDRFEEIFDYFNLFLWNSRKQSPDSAIHARDFFTETGDFLNADKEITFRRLCETYISFVRGENPFTFPFRLPPPDDLIAIPNRKTDMMNKKIGTPIQYLKLTQSFMSEYQASIVETLKPSGLSQYRTICVLPENKDFKDVFEKREGQYFYKTEPFLTPSKVATFSSKFALITKILENSDGLVFIFSNLAELGVQLFAMCLEEHGYVSAIGNSILGETSNETPKGSKGRYALITSTTNDSDIQKILTRLRRRENMNGQDIRVVLASPKVSEGVDFRYVRQIHILDPWFNMSRIEQVIGRGMRVCSHSLLPFEDQNTTVYLHVCRYKDKQKETLDEYIYRAIVEQKGIAIAKVKRVLMESAMDCELEKPVNDLPADWRNLKVPQRRNQDKIMVELSIGEMSSPSFIADSELQCKISPESTDANHTRPLSAILDVKDEILDKLVSMFLRKPIWSFADLYKSNELKQYERELVSYILENIVESNLPLKDRYGRIGHLEIKKGVVIFTMKKEETLQEKLVEEDDGKDVPLRPVDVKQSAKEIETFDLEAKYHEYKFPAFATEFSDDVKRWYFIDNVLPHSDKVQLVLTSNSPMYAHLKTDNLYIFGPNEVYNSKFEKITPIGEEKDEYDGWVKRLKEKFLSQKDLYFAGLKESDEDKKLIFNLDEKAIPIKKAERTKGIGGRACLSYPVGVLDAFMEWLGGSYPASVKNRGDKCMYLDLKVRSSVLEKKQGIVWYTPEEWKVLSEEKKGLK
jgi:superfamily II DNA or RNA helicase